MNFKKYNFLFAFIIAIVIAIPVVTLSSRPTSAETSNPFEDLPPIAEVDSTETTTSQTSKNLKFSDPWSAYNYIKKSTLNNSCIVKSIQNLTASADVGLTKLDFSQKVVLNTYKTKDGKILEETLSSGTKDFFSSTYYDGINTVYDTMSKGKYSIDKKPNSTATAYSKADYQNKFGVLPGFIFDINKNNSKITSTTKSGNIYKFTVVISNSSVWNEYLKKVNILSESESYPTMTSVSLDFELNLKTGNLERLTVNEEYKIRHTGLDVTCTSKTCKAFYNVGEDVKLPELSYMGL